MKRKVRLFLGILLIAISAVLLTWGFFPSTSRVETHMVTPMSMAIPDLEMIGRPAILQERMITLEWPDSMRIGDTKTIELSFTPGENRVITEVTTKLVDAYNDYNLMAEARYEVAGVKVVPANPTRKSLPAGESVSFKWDVSVEKEGDYIGAVWLSLRFVPLDGGDQIQVPIFVKDVKLNATSLFKMDGLTAQLVGGTCLVIALLLCFNDMIRYVRNKISNELKR